MATIAKLDVLLGLEDGSFQRGLEGSRKKLEQWGSSLRSTGTKMTAAITTPLIGAGLVAVNWASDLEQAMGKSDAVFKTSSAAVIEWSKTTADAYGFSSSESLAMASSYGALFKVMGMTDEVAADYSMSLIGLAADMAAFNDVSNERASEALMAGLSGEYMSLRSMGVFLNEAAVSQEALNIAMADGRTEITEADKVQARYNLIMEQTQQQHGQAAREMDGWAGSVARARAKMKDLGAEIGRKLMPFALKLLAWAEDAVSWFTKLSDRTQYIIIAVAAFAAAMGPLLVVIGMLLPGISALIAVIGFLLSPVGLIVVAIAALVAGLVWAYFEFETFREVVNSVASVIRDVAVAAFEKLVGAFNKLKDAFDEGGWLKMFATMGEMLLNGLNQLNALALQGVRWLADRFIEGAISLWNAAATWFQGLWDGAVSKWNEFTGWLGGLVADAATWIADTSSALWQKGVDLIVGLGNGAVAQWTNLKTWISERGTQAASAIGSLLTTLWQKGVDLLIGLGDGAVAQWNNLKIWIGQRGAQAVIAIGNLLTTLWQKGVDLFIGFGDGITAQWANLKTWLSGMGARIVSAVGSLAKTLWDTGTKLVTGFYSAAVEKWTMGGVRSWFVGLGGRIVTAVGDLGSSLYNAGVAIMDGLWNGLKAQWENVKEWLSAINPANYKGPEQRDKKMLYKPGIWIMEGLGRGLDDGWGDVTRQLSSYNPALSGALNAAHAGAGGTVIHHNYFVTPEALKEMIEGGKFAKQFASELGMMEGAA